jgi:hypothetical protein
VAGAREDDFEAAFRDEWMPTLARGGDARLLWFMRQAHGSGPAYTFVTVTGVAHGSAWAELADRVATGDLAKWAAEVDGMRHDLEAKILVPVPWSPLQEIDLASVPADGAEHELTVYMEDTAWPFPGGLGAYLEASGSLYSATVARSRQSGRSILEIEAAFQPAFGTHRQAEVVLWQRIVSLDALKALIGSETPPEQKGPGTWMHDALRVRDRWESRLLRSAAWSPRN